MPVEEFFALCKEGKVEAVKKALADGANDYMKDNDGGTVLMSATVNGRTETVEILVNADADVDARDRDVFTAMMYAEYRSKNTDVLDALFGYSTDLKARDKDGHNVLWYLSRNKEMPPAGKTATP